MAKIDRNRNRVPRDNEERNLQEQKSQTEYLHDIAEYALFIKKYVADKKAQEDSTQSPSSEINQENAKKGAEGFKEEAEFLTSISSLISTIDKINPEKFSKHTGVIKNVGGLINDILGELKMGTKEELEQKMKAMEIVGLFSTGIVNLADHILHSAIKMRLARPFIGMITGTLNRITSQIGSKESIEKSKNAAESVKIISEAILGLSWKVVLAGPLLAIAYPAILVFKGLLALTQWAFKNVDIAAVGKGAKATAEMGLSLIAFAGSIVLASIIMRSAISGQAALGLLMLFSSLTVSLLIFKHFANDDGQLAKGALAVLAISGTLVLFSMALIFSATIISSNPLGVVAVVLILAALATTFYFMGKDGKDKDIATGALTVLAMGFSMWIFAKGMVPLLEVIGKNPVTALAAMVGIPIGLIALGVAYSLLGAADELIIPGALAAAAIGASLWVVGKGLQSMMSLPANITKETADGWEMGIIAIVRGIGKSAGWALLATVALPSLLMISASLPLLAMGIGSFSKVATAWDKTKTDSLTYTLVELTKAYGEAGKSSGLNVMKGAFLSTFMAHGLVSLADGVFAWSSQGKMGKAINELPTIKTNIALILTSIPQLFAEMGKIDKGGEPGSWLKTIVGNDFSKGSIEQGISSSMKMGENLKNLAGGVYEWSSHGKMAKITHELPTIKKNIASVLSTIPQIFGELGKVDKGGEPGSLLKLLVGNDFSKGNIEQGISSSMKMGLNLKNLAEGVFEWSSKGKLGSMTAKELKTVSDNITAVLAVLPMAFAEIGRKDKASEKHWWSDGDIKRGVELVSSLAPTLSAVSNIVKVFADLSASKDGMKPEEMGRQIGVSIQWMAYGISQSAKYLKGGEAKLLGTGFAYVGGGLGTVTKNANEAHNALTKLLNLQKPFDAFMKSFVEFSKNLKEQQIAINAMQLKNLDAYSKLIDGLANLGKSDANVFRENMGYLLGDKLEAPTNFIKRASSEAAAAPQKAAHNVVKSIDEKHTATQQHQTKVAEHNDSLLGVMTGIQQVLMEISGLLKKDNSDALATAIVQKLEHATTPILVKMKGKMD